MLRHFSLYRTTFLLLFLFQYQPNLVSTLRVSLNDALLTLWLVTEIYLLISQQIRSRFWDDLWKNRTKNNLRLFSPWQSQIKDNCSLPLQGGRRGVCSTDLRLDSSTNGLKQVYTSPQAIYYKTYFLRNVHLKIIYNF